MYRFRTLTRESIFRAIDDERLYQEDLYGVRHDDSHSIGQWLAIAYLELAEVGRALLRCDEKQAKAELLQAAAVLVAALEAKGVEVEQSHEHAIKTIKAGHSFQ